MKGQKYPSLLVVAVVFTAYFALAFFATAATIDDLKREIEARNEEIRKLEEEAKKYRDEIVTKQRTGKTLKEELARIERTIRDMKRDIALTNQKMRKKELEVETLTLEIKEKEYSMRKLRGGLADLLQIFAKVEQESPLETLLKYSFLSSFFDRLHAFELFQKRLLGSLDTLHTLREGLADKKAEAEDKKEGLQKLSQSLQDRQEIQKDIQKERSTILQLTKNQEKLYQELLKKTESRQEEILRKIEELEEELRKLVDPASLPKERKGFLQMPSEGILSQRYGETPFTKSRVGRHFYKFHNGIDISAPLGTPVYSAEGGRILGIGDTDKYCPRGAYGKYIVIDHKNNLATMYAHLSLIKVQTSQEVERGDIIGYVGNTGLSTGPHLHFTLYDARTVEIKPGKVGVCGPLPLGGSINPLLYF